MLRSWLLQAAALSAGLAAEVLHASLEKEAGERTSNWEAWPLSAEQRRYAALDALASLLLYQVPTLAHARHTAEQLAA